MDVHILFLEGYSKPSNTSYLWITGTAGRCRTFYSSMSWRYILFIIQACVSVYTHRHTLQLGGGAAGWGDALTVSQLHTVPPSPLWLSRSVPLLESNPCIRPRSGLKKRVVGNVKLTHIGSSVTSCKCYYGNQSLGGLHGNLSQPSAWRSYHPPVLKSYFAGTSELQ